jgi:hypothetical protein
LESIGFDAVKRFGDLFAKDSEEAPKLKESSTKEASSIAITNFELIPRT